MEKEYSRGKMQKILDAFFVSLNADGTTPATTLNAYRTDLSQFMAFLADHGITDIQNLRPNHVQAFCTWLFECGYADATIARRIVALRAFGAFLIQAGILADDPCADLRPPTVARPARRTLRPDEIAAL